MDTPKVPNLQAALKVLLYLKNAPSQGILFSSTSTLPLRAYCDSDWTLCPDSRRFLGSSLIFWKSKKQSVVSQSFVEAEYRAMISTTCELTWLQYILQALHVSHPHMLTYCDIKPPFILLPIQYSMQYSMKGPNISSLIAISFEIKFKVGSFVLVLCALISNWQICSLRPCLLLCSYLIYPS